MTYSKTFDALPPLAFGDEEFTAAAIQAGTPKDAKDYLKASRQHQCRKKHPLSNATPDEIVASKKRKEAIYYEVSGGGGQPAWAQAMEDRLGIRIEIESQRSTNRNLVRSTTDPILKVKNRNGDVPGDNIWKSTVHDIEVVTNGVQFNGLLQFYNLPITGSCNDKRARLKEHLGIVI